MNSLHIFFCRINYSFRQRGSSFLGLTGTNVVNISEFEGRRRVVGMGVDVGVGGGTLFDGPGERESDTCSIGSDWERKVHSTQEEGIISLLDFDTHGCVMDEGIAIGRFASHGFVSVRQSSDRHFLCFF